MVNGFSMGGDTARKWVGNREKTKSTKAYQASVPSVFSVVKNFRTTANRLQVPRSGELLMTKC